MDIILATNNDDKIREMSSLLTGLDITLKTRRDFSSFPDIPETGSTLVENATLKARGIFEKFGVPALADDSGLEVDALDGAPGVFSARYSGPGATYESNCRKILKELEKSLSDSRGSELRSARFHCVIAIAWGPKAESVEIAEGTVEGIVTEEFKGQAGFGYDPIFYYPPSKKTFAEMSANEKNRVSHRGVALQKAKELIRLRLARTVGQSG
jgi:XTP/dITP diphosphohydrolase